jgi:hypothetical protein
MSQKQLPLVPCLIVLAALMPAFARADGGFFPLWGYAMTEYEQLAFLDWDEGAGAETLIIMPGFGGTARDFAWVVPVPAEPEVGIAPRAIFDDLFAVTSPEYRTRENSWDCEEETHYDSGAIVLADVDVIRREVIGVYDVMVVRATDGAALVDSLAAWGFLPPGGNSQVADLVDDYVARGWAFVTMTVDAASFHDAYPNAPYGDFVFGGLQPIQLSFAAAAPVYPLRLSSLSAAWDTRVVVFASADHRLTFAGASAKYANRFGAGEYDALSRSRPLLAARLRPGRFLTRLERTMDPAAMTADLVLTRAPQDDEFHQLEYSGFSAFGLFVAGSVVTWVAWKAGRRLRPRTY